MKNSKLTIRLIILALIMVFGSCRQGPHSSRKQIKKGKPIPCPIKDC